MEMRGTFIVGAWCNMLMNLDDIIRRLRSNDQFERSAAAVELIRSDPAGLSSDDALGLLDAAAEGFPPGIAEWDDKAVTVINFAMQREQPLLYRRLEEIYPCLMNEAKSTALRWLLSGDRESLAGFLRVLRLYAPRGEVPGLDLAALYSRPRDADLIFPEILEYAGNRSFADEIWLTCIKYIQAGLVDAGTLDGITDLPLAEYRRHLAVLAPAQGGDGITWVWEDAYQAARRPAGILLDLFGYLPAEKVLEELQQALQLEDLRLVMIAAVSLLRQKEDVHTDVFVRIASSPETRAALYGLLEGSGHQSQFPAEYFNQAALAESDMVNWLTFPTELGRAPDVIELAEIVRDVDGVVDGSDEMYLFRFRTFPSHWAADKGWIVGWSGPYRHGASPTAITPGGTFSEFAEWESVTREEHIAKIHDMLRDWRDPPTDEEGES